MGLFSGAFGSGLAQGLGTSLAEGIKQRTEQQNKYVDNMMTTARSNASKYKTAAAEVDNSVLQMNNLKRDFDISEAEYIALAQAYPNLDDIYKEIYVTKDAFNTLGMGNKINKDTILKSLKLPENGIELPEGMSSIDALRTIHLNIANNLNKDPNNKTEAHSNGAVSNAFANLFVMNPKSSASDIVKNMQIAGVPVDDLLGFQGDRGTVYDELNVNPFALPETDYTADDMQITSDRYTRMMKAKYVPDGINLSNPEAFNTLLTNAGFKDTAEAMAKLQEIGLNFAKLEKQLIVQSPLFNSNANRAPMLMETLQYINTPEEMEAFNNGVKNNTLAKVLIDSFTETQGLSDKYAAKIFDPNYVGRLDLKGEEATIMRTPSPFSEDLNQPRLSELGITEDSTTINTGDTLVDGILSNTSSEEKVDIKNLDLVDATYNPEENAWYDNLSRQKIVDPRGVAANSPRMRKTEGSTVPDQLWKLIGKGSFAEEYFSDKDEVRTDTELSLWEKIKSVLSKRDANQIEDSIKRRVDIKGEAATLSPAYKTAIERILDSDMSVADKAAAISKIAREVLGTPGIKVSDSYKELKGI